MSEPTVTKAKAAKIEDMKRLKAAYVKAKKEGKVKTTVIPKTLDQ